MKAVFVLFDSLCRNALGCYGSPWVKTPNFDRFAARAVTFDSHFVGSLPCMPARRDLHTGRLNFMHRSWGPLEPFDNSFAASMGDAGIHTHLGQRPPALLRGRRRRRTTGASAPGTSYAGNEYDPWKAMVQPPLERLRAKYAQKHYDLDLRNWKRAPARDQQRVHGRGARPSARALFRIGVRVPRPQPQRRSMVPDARMLRSARAVPGARAVQGAIQDRLDRWRARLAALREGDRQSGRDRRDPRELRGARRSVRPLLRTSSSITSIATTCGATRR